MSRVNSVDAALAIKATKPKAWLQIQSLLPTIQSSQTKQTHEAKHGLIIYIADSEVKPRGTAKPICNRCFKRDQTKGADMSNSAKHLAHRPAYASSRDHLALSFQLSYRCENISICKRNIHTIQFNFTNIAPYHNRRYLRALFICSRSRPVSL